MSRIPTVGRGLRRGQAASVRLSDRRARFTSVCLGALLGACLLDREPRRETLPTNSATDSSLLLGLKRGGYLSPTHAVGVARHTLPALAERVARKEQEIVVELFASTALAMLPSRRGPVPPSDSPAARRRTQLRRFIVDTARTHTRLERRPVGHGVWEATAACSLSDLSRTLSEAQVGTPEARAWVLERLEKVSADLP